MERLTEVVLRNRRKVVIGWVVLLIAAIGAMGPATESLSESFSGTGAGFETNQRIQQLYGTGGQMPPIVPVVTVPEGKTVDSPDVRRELDAAFGSIERAVPNARVASYTSTGDRAFVSEDGRTTYALVYPEFSGGFQAPPEQDAVKEALAGKAVAGAPVQITGFWALSLGDEDADQGPALLLEVLIGGTGALVILTLLFGIRLALLPLLMAVFSIPVTFLLLWPIASITDVSIIVQFLLALIGLGVAIDYALLVVMRWREERAGGRENVDAVRVSMRTAGRAVVFSGTTVAIGLLVMVVLPVPTLRSIGYGGLLIPLVSVAVALTLLPVLLSTIGPKLDRSKHARKAAVARGRWFSWAGWIVRHRWIAAIVSIGALVALAIPSLSMQLGTASAESLAASGPAREAFDNLDDSGLGGGAMSPFELLVPSAQADVVAVDVADVEGVNAVVDPESWAAGGTRILNVVPAVDSYSGEGAQILDRMREQLPSSVAIGGPAENADFVDAVYDAAPLMLGLVLLLTFLLLARALRSILLPLKAVLLNLFSLAAAVGIMVLVWQEGIGSELIWDIAATGAVESWIPIMVFAFLFGLSMDYEVFILTRMREEYDRSGSTNRAVIDGLGHTGRLVTSAALILFFAFAALASAPDTVTKMFATSLAAGILLDATLIRGLLVPAVVSLMGRWNWWLPALPARLLRTQASPLEPPRPVVEPALQPAAEEA
ncbi:MAG: MMPL family transporter [Thermoleophilaceae bacterium]